MGQVGRLQRRHLQDQGLLPGNLADPLQVSIPTKAHNIRRPNIQLKKTSFSPLQRSRLGRGLAELRAADAAGRRAGVPRRPRPGAGRRAGRAGRHARLCRASHDELPHAHSHRPNHELAPGSPRAPATQRTDSTEEGGEREGEEEKGKAHPRAPTMADEASTTSDDTRGPRARRKGGAAGRTCSRGWRAAMGTRRSREAAARAGQWRGFAG